MDLLANLALGAATAFTIETCFTALSVSYWEH